MQLANYRPKILEQEASKTDYLSGTFPKYFKATLSFQNYSSGMDFFTKI